jgi:hypothetical protein
MAPKASIIVEVRRWRSEGVIESEMRSRLVAMQYKKARISQLLTATVDTISESQAAAPNTPPLGAPAAPAPAAERPQRGVLRRPAARAPPLRRPAARARASGSRAAERRRNNAAVTDLAHELFGSEQQFDSDGNELPPTVDSSASESSDRDGAMCTSESEADEEEPTAYSTADVSDLGGEHEDNEELEIFDTDGEDGEVTDVEQDDRRYVSHRGGNASNDEEDSGASCEDEDLFADKDEEFAEEEDEDEDSSAEGASEESNEESEAAKKDEELASGSNLSAEEDNPLAAKIIRRRVRRNQEDASVPHIRRRLRGKQPACNRSLQVVAKKPARARPPRENEKCHGPGGAVNCTWSTAEDGGKARVQVEQNLAQCSFCNNAQFNQLLGVQKGFKHCLRCKHSALIGSTSPSHISEHTMATRSRRTSKTEWL